MNDIAARIVAGDVKVIDAGHQAQSLRQNLYVTDRGGLFRMNRNPRAAWALSKRT